MPVAQTFDRLLRAAHSDDPRRPGGPWRRSSAPCREQDRRPACGAGGRLKGRELLDARDIARAEAAVDAAEVVAALEPALDALPEGEHEVLRLVTAGLPPKRGRHPDRHHTQRGPSPPPDHPTDELLIPHFDEQLWADIREGT